MHKVLFVTGSQVKFRTASLVCRQEGIELVQLPMGIPEIQAADGETVARDKAQRIFEKLQKPIIISDDSWMIPALKNFPGAYMKFVNEAFTPKNWLHLTNSLTDRRIILRQIVVYQDGDQQQKVFYTDLEGSLLRESRGKGYAHNTITSFDGGKTTLAEAIEQGKSVVADSGKRTSWHEFCEWYASKQEHGHA